MRGLLRADVYRLRRRPEIWIIAIALPIFGAIGFISDYFGVPGHYFYSDPTPPPDVVTAIAAEQGTYAFPLSIIRMLDDTGWVTIAVFFLVCTSIGAEFPWGTIRTALLARSERAPFLAARVISFIAIATVIVAALIVLGAILPAVLAVMGESPTPPIAVGPADLASVAAARLLLVVFTIALAALVTVITRNAALAFLVALAYVVGELVLAGNAVFHHSDTTAVVARSMPVTSVLAVVDQTGALAQGFGPAPVDPTYVIATFPLWLSFAVPVFWTVAFLAAAFAVIRRADIRE